jgi:glycine/D-amino acid oxidase-like deaminating enzyme
MRIPNYLSGVFSPDAGVVQVKHALKGTHDLAIQQGADLRYSKNVVNIDHEKSIVTLETGETF